MINVDEISHIVNHRNRMKKETYVELYKRTTRKIRRAVETGNKYALIEIPAFIVGYPIYDRVKATSYIKRQLEIAGFDVVIVGNFEFRVTWKIKKDVKVSTASIDECPPLMNLKTAANQYRRDARNA